VRDGDVIVSTVRTYLRAIARVDDPEPNLVVSTGFAVVRPKEGLTAGFAGYLLAANYFLEQVIARSTGVSYPAINASELVSILVPVPAPDEQRTIAAVLDRETAKIDALVAEQQRLIDLLKEKRQAVISHAVTKGLNPDARMKTSGLEWLGHVPGHWPIVQVKHLAAPGAKTFTDGDWIEAPYIADDGVRLIQTGNIGIGFYKEQGFRYVSDATFDELGCTEVKPRDVLVCRLDGAVGRACLAPDLGVRMITSVDNAILKTRADVVPEYVVHLLSSGPWLEWIDVLCRVGGGFGLRISRRQLGELRVPLPPAGEQAAIVKYLASGIVEWDALIAQATRAIALLQERRTALISAAVTGQIDVRAATERPAA
jgi:type I restriction enzyme S subunit